MAILLLATSCLVVFGQGKKALDIDLNFDDGCGNPFVESQLYERRKGTVIRVTGSNDLVVKVTSSNNVWKDEHQDGADGSKLIRPQVFKVFLVGIDTTFNKKGINKFLRENVLGKRIEIVGNTEKGYRREKAKERELFAVVSLLDGQTDDADLSEYLLGNGIARFKAFELTNLVPMRTRCVLARANADAKRKNLGIWSN